MQYYRATFVGLALLALAAVSTLLATFEWQHQLQKTFETSLREAQTLERAKTAAEAKVKAREDATQTLIAFARAWKPYREPALGRDLGNHLRNALSVLATRTGLTSEGASVPAEPRPYAVGGSTIKVQQISVNVISESLPALLTWLGEVEGQFAYARVESLTLSSYASHSVQLSVTLLQPMAEDPGASDEKAMTTDVSKK